MHRAAVQRIYSDRRIRHAQRFVAAVCQYQVVGKAMIRRRSNWFQFDRLVIRRIGCRPIKVDKLMENAERRMRLRQFRSQGDRGKRRIARFSNQPLAVSVSVIDRL